jgi:homoserine kinase type II
MAVYTEIADDELAQFIDSYGLGSVVSCKGIAEGVENTNYLVGTSSGQFILTLYEKRVAAGDLPFFLGLMEHLASKGLSCPTPVRDGEGRNLRELAGRPAALVTFLEGVWLRKPQAQHCHKVGVALAKLHEAGRDFALSRPNALGPEGWPPLFERFRAQADQVAPGLGGTIEEELTQLLRDWPQRLPAGVIHADLFPDNVFFRGDQLSGLIDFYFACNDLFAYDIAVCLNAWCFTPQVVFDRDKGAALLAGYQSVRPLGEAERAALPTLARGAALRFLLTRAHDWVHTPAGALVVKHDPVPYLQRLQFHAGVVAGGSASDYGLGPAS